MVERETAQNILKWVERNKVAYHNTKMVRDDGRLVLVFYSTAEDKHGFNEGIFVLYMLENFEIDVYSSFHIPWDVALFLNTLDWPHPRHMDPKPESCPYRNAKLCNPISKRK